MKLYHNNRRDSIITTIKRAKTTVRGAKTTIRRAKTTVNKKVKVL